MDKARWQKADQAYQHALDIQEKQAKADPQAPEVRYALAKTYHAFGYMHDRAGRPESAEPRYQQALELLGKLDQDDSGVTELIAETEMRLGNVYIRTNRPDRAEPALTEAERIYRRLVAGPDVPAEHWFSLAQSLVMMGVVDKDRRHFKKAEAAQQEALGIFEKLAKEHGEVLEYLYGEGRCQSLLGGTAYDADRMDDALASYDRAIKIMTPLVGKGYPRAQEALRDAQIMRAAVRVRLGDHARAAEELEELARQADLRDVLVYNIACAFSRASAAVDRDTKLSAAERAQLRARYADRSVGFLHKAVDKGYRYPNKIKNDSDLEPLRGRQDFQKVIADLQAKEKE
jgi:tetratricopeptide (TPR) repeat protein